MSHDRVDGRAPAPFIGIPFYTPRYNKDCDCNCSIRADHTWKEKRKRSRSELVLCDIYTYVHMCILLSEKHGGASRGGRFGIARISLARSRSESLLLM